MFFNDEPAWMKKARTVPLRTTWESRQRAEKPAPANQNEAQKRAMS
jgi:hypothetical protein